MVSAGTTSGLGATASRSADFAPEAVEPDEEAAELGELASGAPETDGSVDFWQPERATSKSSDSPAVK